MPISAWGRPLTPARRVAAALVTAGVVALTVHVATAFIYFVSRGAATDVLGAVNEYFWRTTLVLFAVLFLGAALGGLRRWYGAVALGLFGSIVAVFLGTSWAYVASGSEWGPDAVGIVWSTLIGAALPFIVFATIAAVTPGQWVWAWATRFRLETTPVAFVRQPSAQLQSGELTHIERTTVDLERADEQWDAYVAALADNGFDIVDVDPSDQHPDSVFVEDTLVIFGGLAVVASLGAESRRGETDAAASAARELGLTVRELQLPGTLDGGDVLKVGSTVYVGRGGRTNAEGIRQLRAIVTPLGYTVIAVPVKKVLHLKTAVTALPDGTVVGDPRHIEDTGVFERFLALPEPGAAVVVLSDDAVLMATSTPRSAALIADLGYRVVTVDVSEFEKLEGCVTCLSVRVR